MRALCHPERAQQVEGSALSSEAGTKNEGPKRMKRIGRMHDQLHLFGVRHVEALAARSQKSRCSCIRSIRVIRLNTLFLMLISPHGRHGWRGATCRSLDGARDDD